MTLQILPGAVETSDIELSLNLSGSQDLSASFSAYLRDN